MTWFSFIFCFKIWLILKQKQTTPTFLKFQFTWFVDSVDSEKNKNKGPPLFCVSTGAWVESIGKWGYRRKSFLIKLETFYLKYKPLSHLLEISKQSLQLWQQTYDQQTHSALLAYQPFSGRWPVEWMGLSW